MRFVAGAFERLYRSARRAPDGNDAARPIAAGGGRRRTSGYNLADGIGSTQRTERRRSRENERRASQEMGQPGMSPLGILPLLSFSALFLAVLQEDQDSTSAFIKSAVSWAALATVLSEGLSLTHSFKTGPVAGFWLLVFLGCLAWVARRYRQRGRLSVPRLALPPSGFLRFLAFGVGVYVLAMAVVAWYAPPNTWDALTYHMSRVAHWAQDGSINHYATGIDTQDSMPQGASILALQLYVLARGDWLVNFVQWFSMVGCLLVVARIATRLGASEAGRWYAVAFAVTLPTGIMQATAVTTDYVVALWIAIVVLETIELWQGRGGGETVLLLGLAAGLAISTKQTALAYLAPFALLLGWILFRRSDRNRLIAWCVPAFAILLLFGTPSMLRNLTTYGYLAGPPTRVDSQVNQILDGRVLISNVLRNASLHAGTPFPHINKGLSLALLWIHRQIGLDPNDPRTTAEGTFRIRAPTLHETTAGNSLHAYLLVVVLLLGLVVRRRAPPSVWPYTGLVFATFLILSATFEWKPSGARYQLAFFLLMAPTAGVLLGVFPWKRLAPLFVSGMLVLSMPWLLGNHSRPLLSGWPGADAGSVLTVPRNSLYFANAPYVEEPYLEIVDHIRQSGCQQIGIALPGEGLEYPFWALLGAPREALRIEWLVGGTASARYVDPGFNPCAVVCEKCPSSWDRVRGLPEVYHNGSFKLYLGEGDRTSPSK
jgi:hypothetical protein